MWLRLGMRFNIRVALFCIRCNISIWLFGRLERILLQKSKLLVIKASKGMNKLCSGIKSLKVPNSSDAMQLKMSRLANTTNMIIESEILVKNYT